MPTCTAIYCSNKCNMASSMSYCFGNGKPFAIDFISIWDTKVMSRES